MNTNATTELAVRLRGVVKRYGEITAVGGRRPVRHVRRPARPNGAGKTTTNGLAMWRLGIRAMTRKLVD